LKGATIPYRPVSTFHQQGDDCSAIQQHFFTKVTPPPPIVQKTSLSPTPPPSSTTCCSRTESPIMTSQTQPLVVMTSPYINGTNVASNGEGGGGGIPSVCDPSVCNIGSGSGGDTLTTYFSPINNINNNNNPISTTSGLFHQPTVASHQQHTHQTAQSTPLNPPPLVKPFLNATTPSHPQYIFFPPVVPLTEPFPYPSLINLGGNQTGIPISQSNLLAGSGLQPQYYSPSPFTGLEQFMNLKNCTLGALTSTSLSHPAFLNPNVQMTTERSMMHSSLVPDVSCSSFNRYCKSTKAKERLGKT